MEWAVLAALAAVIWLIVRRVRAKKRRKPPALPPRVNVTPYTPHPVVFRGAPPQSGNPALPPRRLAAPAAVGGTTQTADRTGPRGIRPDQFPCCPFDKQRNEPGKAQTIFWDSRSNCYVCSRGHRFKSNGTIL